MYTCIGWSTVQAPSIALKLCFPVADLTSTDNVPLLSRTSDVGFTSVLIKSVHILEAGLWHSTSGWHELHTNLIASHKNLLRSHSLKWLQLSSLLRYDAVAIGKHWPSGRVCYYHLQIGSKIVIWTNLIRSSKTMVTICHLPVSQVDFILHQHKQQILKYRKIVCHPLNKGSTTCTEWALFTTCLYEHVNEPTPEAADLSPHH